MLRYALALAVILVAAGAQEKKPAMSHHASGTFDVKIAPQSLSDIAAGPSLGRMSLDKQYHGDLDATGKGEMLTAMSPEIKNSGTYVAVERVEGTLSGRKGTFCLQHMGVMNRGAQSLTVTVVPDSGTGELTGISGTLTIKIEGAKHFYEFDYKL
jgi:hypothetical protein